MYVRRRVEVAVFRNTDTTDVIFERLISWYRAHPPSESLMRDLSLLQQATEQRGGVDNYYSVTVYAAAMEAVNEVFQPRIVKRTRSWPR